MLALLKLLPLWMQTADHPPRLTLTQSRITRQERPRYLPTGCKPDGLQQITRIWCALLKILPPSRTALADHHQPCLSAFRPTITDSYLNGCPHLRAWRHSPLLLAYCGLVFIGIVSMQLSASVTCVSLPLPGTTLTTLRLTPHVRAADSPQLNRNKDYSGLSPASHPAQ